MSASQEPVSEALRRLTASLETEPDDAEWIDYEIRVDLYERAKELDIPRRSAMTKDELARAIARREG